MYGKSCFLMGNRNTPCDIRTPLIEAVETHIIEYGVTNFTVGRYGMFDSMAIGILKETKKRHNNIKLYLLTPYAFTRKTDVPNGFDGTFYPLGLERVPYRLAIVQANKYMVKNSDYLISYCHYIGNTKNIVDYAQKQEKRGLIKVTLL